MNWIMGLFSGSYAFLWLAAAVVFLILEAAVPGLVSIWFAAGAVVAFISALFKAPFWLQLLWFVIVSVAALAITRPLAGKLVNANAQPTNADMIIGEKCIVTEDIDNIQGKGAVSFGGKIWTARAQDNGFRPSAGEIVTAVRIDGVKVIVKECQQKADE